MEGKLSLLLFGGFELTTVDGRPVTVPVKKSRALLSWLALQAGSEHSRDRLASLLWSDSSEQQARHSLRQALSALRKTTPTIARALTAGHEHVRLDTGVVHVDALSLEHLDSDRSCNEQWLLDTYRGDFLEGLTINSPPFDDWLMERRDHYRRLVSGRFEATLAIAMEETRLADAIRIGIRLVTLEPLREDIHRTLMQCYSSLGRIPDALQQYRLCRATLERELGVAPSRETESLKVRLMSKRARVSSPTGVRTEAAPIPTATRRHPELRQTTLVGVAPDPRDMNMDPRLEDRALGALISSCRRFAEKYGLASPLQASHCVILVFGSPRTSSNDSLRALQLAMELSSAGDARIAVASGRAMVYLEVDDNGHTVITRVTGAVMRQVETLCELPGTMRVVISESVRLSCLDYARVCGPLAYELPGGVRTWQLDTVDVHHPVRRLPGFVGRRLEFGQLTMMFNLCRDGGHGHVFMIRGDAGIGKSRLANKALDDAAAHGDLCLQYRAGDRAGGGHDNLISACLSGGVSCSLDAADSDVEPRMITEFLTRFDFEPELVEYGSILFETAGSNRRRAVFETLDNIERTTYERRLLETFVERITTHRSIVLMIEDIHLAGEYLMNQLADLAGMTTRHRLVLLMTSRLQGEALNATWRGAMRGAPMTTIDLQPLPLDDSRRLAERLAGSDHPKLEQCVSRSNGNPLFLEQLLLAADHGDSTLPDSIQSIVDGRLDSLSESERNTVRAAAVLGPRFAIGALVHVLANDVRDIDGLMAKGLLIIAGQEGRFLHELIQHGIYESVLIDERDRHHRRAAEYHESRDAFEFAWHVVSGNQDGCEETCLNVVDQLSSCYDFDRALALAEQALRIKPRSFRLLELKAWVLQSMGATRMAVQVYEQALSIQPSARSHMGIAEALIVLDDYDEALVHLQRLDQSVGEDCYETHAKSAILKSRVAFSKGYMERCLEHGNNAVRMARKGGDIELEIESISSMADAQYQRGQMSLAGDLFNESFQLAIRHGVTRLAAINLAMVGWIQLYQGHTAEALRDALRSSELALEARNRRHQAIIDNILSAISYQRGELEHGVDFARRSLDICLAVGSIRFELEAHCMIGYYDCMRGDRNAGFARILESARRMAKHRPAYAGPWLLSIAAQFAPDAQSAHALLDEGEKIMTGISCVSHNQVHFYQNAIERMFRDNRLDEAERYIEDFETYLDERDIPFGDLCCRRGRALLEVAASPHERAPRIAAEAINREIESLGLLQLVTPAIAEMSYTG